MWEPFLVSLFAGKEKIQQNTDDSGEADATDGERAKGEDGTADTDGQRDGCDDDIARHVEVDLMLDHVLHTHRGDRAEEQQHDATQNGRGDGLQQGRDLADDGEDNTRNGSDADDLRMGDTRDLHGTCHLTIGGHWRTAHEGSKETSQTVAKHRAMQTRRLDEVFLSHSTHHIDIADMLDHWGDGHRNHEHKGLPGKLRQLEVGDAARQGKPRGSGHSREVDEAHEEGHDITHDDAYHHRNELHKALAKGEHEDGGDQRDEGQEPVLLRHVHGSRRERETDEDDDWTDDHRGEETGDERMSLPLDEGRHHEVDQCHASDTCYRARHAPLLRGRDDRGDEGEAGAKEDGHLAFGDQMEDKRTDTSGKKRRSGVETNEQGHQDRRAKGYKEELDTDDGLSGG